MLKLDDVDEKDYKYIVKNPDSSFSPERNRAIIAETIKETNNYFKKMHETLDVGIAERVNTLSYFAKYKLGNGGPKNLEQFLGRENYTKLIGENILSKVRVMDSVNKLNNNKKYNKTILL